MISYYIILFLGVIQILDSVTNFGILTSELSVQKLGKKRAKYFSILVGIFLILISMYLLTFHNE